MGNHALLLGARNLLPYQRENFNISPLEMYKKLERSCAIYAMQIKKGKILQNNREFVRIELHVAILQLYHLSMNSIVWRLDLIRN